MVAIYKARDAIGNLKGIARTRRIFGPTFALEFR